MATIAKMAINLGWNGQQAEDGLGRTASELDKLQKKLAGMSTLDRQRFMDKWNRDQKVLGMTAKQQLAFEAKEKAEEKAKRKAERWAEMSPMEKIKESLKGMNDLKALIEMLRGITQMVTAVPRALLGLGGELETMQIKMGLLVGSGEKGRAMLEDLRAASRDLGVPLGEVAGSFQKIVTAGVNAGDAEKLVRTFATVSPLLGQGGLEQVASGIAEMARTGVADASTLQNMQANGIKVYEALAARLSKVQGAFVSVDDAIAAVNSQAVEASTAVLAMQDAVKTPEVLNAAQQFANSFEGQLARLKESATDLMRDIGKAFIDGLDIPAFLASLRGVLDAVASIVRLIAKSFAEIAGPNGDSSRLEANFRAARDYGFTIAEVITKSANDFYTQFQSIYLDLELAAKKVTITFDKGVSGLISGETADLIDTYTYLNDLQKKHNEEDRLAREKDIAGFFEKARSAAANSDQQKRFDFSLPKSLGGMFEPVQIKQKALASSDPLQQRIDSGSAAAAEAIMRNNTRNGSKDKQQEQIDATKDVGEKVLQVVQAITGVRMPAVAVLPK